MRRGTSPQRDSLQVQWRALTGDKAANFCGDVPPPDWAHSSRQRRQIITLLANSRQKFGPNIPRYASNKATDPAHQLGSCVDLVTGHEDSAFVLRVRKS